MYVGRALAVGLGDYLVYEADNRSLLAHLVDVDLRHRAEIVVHRIAAILDHLLDGVCADAVVLLDGLLDILLRGEGSLDDAASYEPEAVRRLGVERIARDDGKRAVGDGERQH